ncbi:MAG: flippase [archaeon]
MEDKSLNNNFEHSLKFLVKTSFIVFIGVFLSKILGYVYRIIIARYYGPEAYGLFSLAIMILGWVIAICSFGLVDGLYRFVPQYRGKKEYRYVSYLFRFTNRILLVSSIVSAILLFFLSDFISINFFHNIELSLFLKILSFFIPTTVLSGSYLLTIKGYEFINNYSFIYNILQNIVKVLVLILLVLIGFKSSSTIISFCIGLLAVFIASYYFCKYKIPELFIKYSISRNEKKKIRSSFLSYSIPLLFFGIISMIFYWTDSFFLGYFKGAEAVGFYNVAVPIALLLAIMPELFMQLFFPMINRHYSTKNFGLIKKLSKQLGKWIFLANFPLFILILIFPCAAINILFGSQYLVAETALRILVFSSFIASLFIISNNLLSMAGKSKLILIDIVLASIINIILNTLLIPMPTILGFENSVGIMGAAIATSISVIFLNMLFFIQAKIYLDIIPLKKKMINIFMIGTISAAGLFFLRNKFPSQNLFLILFLIVLFLIVYLILIIIFRALDKNDIDIIKSAYYYVGKIKRKVM